jgi:hypothetical protein
MAKGTGNLYAPQGMMKMHVDCNVEGVGPVEEAGGFVVDLATRA